MRLRCCLWHTCHHLCKPARLYMIAVGLLVLHRFLFNNSAGMGFSPLSLRVGDSRKDTGIALRDTFDILTRIILLSVLCKDILMFIRVKLSHAFCDYFLEIYCIILTHIAWRTGGCHFIFHQTQTVTVLFRWVRLFITLHIIAIILLHWISARIDQITIFIIELLYIKFTGIAIVLICILLVSCLFPINAIDVA